LGGGQGDYRAKSVEARTARPGLRTEEKRRKRSRRSKTRDRRFEDQRKMERSGEDD